MAKSWLIGDYPVIGIRPTIDGRRWKIKVRESLEDQTMDMDPMTIKVVLGFNGTERPGAVYLASVLATHSQKGLPVFGIYDYSLYTRMIRFKLK